MPNSKLICAVDDEEVFHWIVRGNLKRAKKPCKLMSFYDGEEIFKYLSNGSNSRPDIILLDINMPICDGWKFLENYSLLKKSYTKDINIYVVTSSIDPKDQQRAELSPFVKEFVSKPITVDFLDGIID